MRNRYLLIFTLGILLSACGTKYKNPHIEIQTKFGDIEVELYPDQAPKTVANILAIIKRGYYKNSSFYRVLNDENQPSNAPKAELIQGGIHYTSKASAGQAGIPHETTKQTGILHKRGTISMARLEPGSATSEFFICVADQPGFDFGGENNADKQGYAAFGKVVKGMEIVNKIYNQPEENQKFDPVVDIYDIKQL